MSHPDTFAGIVAGLLAFIAFNAVYINRNLEKLINLVHRIRINDRDRDF